MQALSRLTGRKGFVDFSEQSLVKDRGLTSNMHEKLSRLRIDEVKRTIGVKVKFLDIDRNCYGESTLLVYY